jgi:U3 small nucleolar ribonucleoprotein component
MVLRPVSFLPFLRLLRRSFSLFDTAASLSRHERRLLALSSQIASLEAENVGVKNWATKGEAKARDRPTNSLLDEDLEYERTGKVVPVITEETTKTIEELIKNRILEVIDPCFVPQSARANVHVFAEQLRRRRPSTCH